MKSLKILTISLSLSSLLAVFAENGASAPGVPEPNVIESTLTQDRARAEVERSGNRLLDEAEKSYKRGEYWNSSIDLIIILDFHSEYSRLDEALYLLGNCLYEMGMYEATNQLYRYLLKTIPKTTLLPKAMLGMQKAYYQQLEYQLSLKFYKALETHYPTFDGMDESRYYASQAYYHLNSYSLVPNIVGHIKKNSDFYAFGLYTQGLANLKKKISGKPSRISSS